MCGAMIFEWHARKELPMLIAGNDQSVWSHTFYSSWNHSSVAGPKQ